MTKSTLDETVGYRGLREWLEHSEGFGELLKIDGAHWDTEMGAITHMMTEKSRGQAPAILFDNIPGYPAGFRTLYGQFSSIKRVALTLGLPLEHARKVDIVKAYHERIRTLKPLPPKIVETGPILENVITGDACDVLMFPVPRHHEADKARFIGTADGVITLDPDEGWYNVGAYRSQVYDGKTIGCQITEGKHGRIHRDKYFERGEPMKVVILCGQDPLLFMLSASPLPDGISEIDFMGGLRGEPVECVRGPFTGFPIPADCEIAIEGEMVPGQVLPEGPFGEWMGYYSDDSVPRPYVNVKTILHRNNPILCCAPQHKPVDETGLLKGIAGAAEVWRALDACGIPDVLGVWNHEAGPATRFTVVQIIQRYPGHSRNALHIAANCQGRCLCRQVDGGGRRGHRRRRPRPGAVGDEHPLRSDDRHRPDPEGMGVQARSAVAARQLQQPHPGRCMHPVRHEAEEDLPDGGRRQRRAAREDQGEVDPPAIPGFLNAGPAVIRVLTVHRDREGVGSCVHPCCRYRRCWFPSRPALLQGWPFPRMRSRQPLLHGLPGRCASWCRSGRAVVPTWSRASWASD